LSAATHVVYEVALELDPRIVGEYDTWLELHMREVLACEGFETGRVFVPEDARADDGWVRRTVHYHVASRDQLQRYFDGPAAALRQQGLDRFGTKFRASRRVLAPRSELATPAGATRGTSASECANCGTPVDAEFCAHCGQENKVYLRGFHKVLGDFLGDLLNFDSRFFGSVWPLFARPGLLTKEYLAGRRVRFIPPVRMYLFASLFFFGMVAVWVSTASPEFFAQANRQAAADIAKERGEGDLPPVPAPPSAQGAPSSSGPSVHVGSDEPEFKFSDSDPGWVKDAAERMKHNFEKIKADKDFRRLLFDRGVGNLPLMMFLLLPIYALLLKLLYLRSGRYYVEHIIFALHTHSAIFLGLGGVLAWFVSAPLFGYRAAPPGLLIAAFAMKRMYGQGWWKTSIKYLILGSTYFVLLFVAIVGAVVYTLST
jgi:hypothetical protein